MLIEKDFVLDERHPIKVTVTFKPVGLWRKVLCWFGLEYPGPILIEIRTGIMSYGPVPTRFFFKRKVVEQVIVLGYPGEGLFKAALNPEDFRTFWNINVAIEPLYN